MYGSFKTKTSQRSINSKRKNDSPDKYPTCSIYTKMTNSTLLKLKLNKTSQVKGNKVKKNYFSNNGKSNNLSSLIRDNVEKTQKKKNFSKMMNKFNPSLPSSIWNKRITNTSSFMDSKTNKVGKPVRKGMRKELSILKEKIKSLKHVYSKTAFTSPKAPKKGNLYINFNNRQAQLKKLDFNFIFETEQFVFNISKAIAFQKDFYNDFKGYLDLIQDFDCDEFCVLLDSNKESTLFKNVFILERTSLMTCFYLFLNNMIDAEINILQKLSFLV